MALTFRVALVWSILDEKLVPVERKFRDPDLNLVNRDRLNLNPDPLEFA
jgi:hypothetical protein